MVTVKKKNVKINIQWLIALLFLGVVNVQAQQDAQTASADEDVHMGAGVELSAAEKAIEAAEEKRMQDMLDAARLSSPPAWNHPSTFNDVFPEAARAACTKLTTNGDVKWAPYRWVGPTTLVLARRTQLAIRVSEHDL